MRSFVAYLSKASFFKRTSMFAPFWYLDDHRYSLHPSLSPTHPPHILTTKNTKYICYIFKIYYAKKCLNLHNFPHNSLSRFFQNPHTCIIRPSIIINPNTISVQWWQNSCNVKWLWFLVWIFTTRWYCSWICYYYNSKFIISAIL